MKTLHIKNGKILNISDGEPQSKPPEGVAYQVVENDFRAGIGWNLDGENWVDPTPKPVVIPSPNWLAFNVDLLAISGYKTWEKTIKKSTADDIHYFDRLFVAFALERVENAQYWYDQIVTKPSVETRTAANDLARLHNIKMVFK